ncbi:MAG: AMP-binding protein [Phycisphaeraceae bacterium]|nr:AMP-binding protein [Phycisphaeraceae bacterium]
MPLAQEILRTLLRHPFRVATIDDRGPRKGIELIVGALHLAELIERRSRSQTVGIMLPTGAGMPVASLAVWMLGRTVVPLNYVLKPEELQYVIDDCGTDIVITAQAFLDAVNQSPSVPNLVKLDRIPFSGAPEPRWPVRVSEDDLAVLLYTSGTSGKPKGVMLTHRNILSNIKQCLDWVHFTDRDVLLGVIPQFHSFGLTVLTLLPLVTGCRAIYTAKFVPNKIIKLMREHRPTAFVGIPSMYNALLHLKDATPDDFRSLRLPISGGEPLPAAVLEAFEARFGIRLCEGYGLTETSPVTNVCRPEEWRQGSVGRPVPGVHERIIDLDTGRDLPPGHDGEIRIAGPNVMRGYFNLPKETAAAFDSDGYFRTGDIGQLDSDGFLKITGRLKEMLIVAGENVFPREIEDVLNRHPAVRDSGVVGASDPMRGEIPIAFVEMNEGAPFDEREILDWCRERLAGYKVPREVRSLHALPRNPTGKIMRRELKKMI